MKKLHISLVIIALLLLCAVVFTSCQDNSLNKPSGLNLDVSTQTLKWNFVKGARHYAISISGQEKDIVTKNNYVSLENLDPGEYEIKVQAISGNDAYGSSDYAVFRFTREAESGLKYQLINNDTEFQLIGGGTAIGDVVMESVYRGKPVTSIADKALYGNIRITSLVVGDNVKTIGDKAFTKCSKLTSVVIPEGVTSIGVQAFQSCKALISVTLPDSITVLPANIFDWCSSMTSVKIGRAVTSLGEYAFANCEALTTITYEGADHSEYQAVLPETLTTINNYAFNQCYALSSLSLGGTESIGVSAFSQCTSLAKLDLGVKLKTIGQTAFSNCTSLNNVTIPDSTEEIGDGAFNNCSLLKNVHIGAGVKSIGVSAFLKTKLLDEATDMLVLDGWLIQYLNNTSDKLTVAESDGIIGIADYAFASNAQLVQVNIKGVKYVGYAAFFQCGQLMQVSFDNALLEIGEYAFSKCPYLTTVNVGGTLKTIGSYAFYGCEKLKSMALPATVTSIGTRAFRETGAYKDLQKKSKGVLYMGDWAVDYIATGSSSSTAILQDDTRGIANYTFNAQDLLLVRLPEGLEYIGRGAFYNAPVYMVNRPSTLKSIGDYAFYGCSYASFGGEYFDLVIPNGTEYIGRSAFYNCSNILSINVPGTVKTIGAYAFYGCKYVGMDVEFKENTEEVDENGDPITVTVTVEGYIKLGNGIESIGDRAFQGCTSIEEIVIPDSVTYLGKRAFYKCESLKSVTLGEKLTEISEYTFYKCQKLESVVISDDLETIGNYAFRGCVALKSFDFKSVVTIGRYSFYGCSSLTKIVLPKVIISVGDYAFRGCNNVSSIIIPISLNNIGKHVFYGLKATTIYCEADAAKTNWNVQYNSSFRPTFFGCTLSDDKQYVVSIVAGADYIVNYMATGGISDPIRQGYVFDGWATEEDATTGDYTSLDVFEAPEGTVLYAVWKPAA